jgi:hypothetical protein
MSHKLVPVFHGLHGLEADATSCALEGLILSFGSEQMVCERAFQREALGLCAMNIISRLCCLGHLCIWNGTKKRDTDTAARASPSRGSWALAAVHWFFARRTD